MLVLAHSYLFLFTLVLPWCVGITLVLLFSGQQREAERYFKTHFASLSSAGLLFKSSQQSEVPRASWAFWIQLSSYFLGWWKEDARGPCWQSPAVWWLRGNPRTLKIKYIKNFWNFVYRVCKVGKSRKYLASSLFLLLPLASSLSSPSFDLLLLACLSHLGDIRSVLSQDWITAIKDVKDKRWGENDQGREVA